MSETVAFNINHYVRVRLTQYGKLVHRRHYDKLRREYPSALQRYAPPKADEDGYTQWQMWELMQIFGPAISLGMETPFETEILLEQPYQGASVFALQPTLSEPPQSPD